MSFFPPNPNGQTTMANSSPVVIASDQVLNVSSTDNYVLEYNVIDTSDPSLPLRKIDLYDKDNNLVSTRLEHPTNGPYTLVGNLLPNHPEQVLNSINFTGVASFTNIGDIADVSIPTGHDSLIIFLTDGDGSDPNFQIIGTHTATGQPISIPYRFNKSQDISGSGTLYTTLVIDVRHVNYVKVILNVTQANSYNFDQKGFLINNKFDMFLNYKQGTTEVVTTPDPFYKVGKYEANLNSITDGDITHLKTDSFGRLVVIPRNPGTTSPGFLPFRNSAVNSTPILVKNGATNLYSMNVFNPGTSIAYLKFYNAPTVTLGTTPIISTIPIAPNQVIYIEPNGTPLRHFNIAFSIAATLGFADNNTVALTTPLHVEFLYV